MTPEQIKVEHDRLLPQIPEACYLSLYYKANYGVGAPLITGDKEGWVNQGLEWTAYIKGARDVEGLDVSPCGTGKTADEAVVASIRDFHSKRARVSERQLAEFR